MVRELRNITKPEVTIVAVFRRIHDIPEGVAFRYVMLNFNIPACAKPVKPTHGYFDYIFDYYMRVNMSEPLPEPITENINCPDGWSQINYVPQPPPPIETLTTAVSTQTPSPTETDAPETTDAPTSPESPLPVSQETNVLPVIIAVVVVFSAIGALAYLKLRKHL